MSAIAMGSGLWSIHSRRLRVVLLLAFCSFCSNLFVGNFGLTLTYMVADQGEQNGTQSKCGQGNDNEFQDYGGTLNWSRRQEDILLSATPWGSLFAQLPSLCITRYFSSSRIIFIAMFSQIIYSSLIPFCAVHIGYYAVFTLFSLFGISHAFYLVAIFTLIDKWFPRFERSTAVAVMMIGVQAGGVLGGPITGIISTSWMGWQANFYLRSLFGGMFCLLWWFYGGESPHSCPKISKEESQYLTKHVHVKEKTKDPVPLLKILTSIPVWAEVIMNFGTCVAVVITASFLPRFFKEDVLVSPIMNGFFVAIPNLIALVFRLIWCSFVDSLKRKKLLTNTASVKISQGISTSIVVIFYILMGYLVGCDDPGLVLFFATMISAAQSMESAGRVTAMLSVAPQYSETITAISLFFAQLSRLGTPYMVTLLQKDDPSHGWRKLFTATSAINFAAIIIFLIFGSGSEQTWAAQKTTSNKKKNAESSELMKLNP